MPEIVTTWTIRHRRILEAGEDPLAEATADLEHILWAVEEGDVVVAVEILE